MKNQSFADLIEQNIEKLVEEWMNSVRADETIISADDLSEGGLRDHIPQVLKEMSEVVGNNEEPNIFNTREARVNAYTRYCQNYRAQDLAAELSLLRINLLDFLAKHHQHHKTATEFDDFFNTIRTIDLYIDEEMRYGFSIFSKGLKET